MDYKVEQWRTVDIKIHTSKNYEMPFEDVDVFGTFTGPEGKVLKLLAFWNGNGTWVLRFAPVMTGVWHLTTESTDPDNPDFVIQKTIQCVPYEGSEKIYRHGFLKVSEDRDYLTYGDGTPFFWLGDTHWEFITEERFDESNCLAYESQFRACADRRRQQGFTVYQCNFRESEDKGSFGRSIELMHRTDRGFTPNLEAFQNNVDIKMKYLADTGWCIAVGYAWFDDIITNGQERYLKLAKYTAARYGAYPVVWTLAGELPGYMGDTQEKARLWNAVARVCEKWSPYENLQSAHLACTRPFLKLYEKESWFDFAMCQGGHGDMDMGQEMYDQFKEMYKGHPVLESEAIYEGIQSREYVPRTTTAAMMRRQAYLIMQSGGCGYSYGANGIWELQWEAGKGGIGWGDMAWWEGLELPGARQLTIFKAFYEAVRWWELKPLSPEYASTDFFGVEAPPRFKIFFTGDPALKTIVGYITPTSSRAFLLKGLSAAAYQVWYMDPETGLRKEGSRLYPEEGKRPL